VDAAFLTCFLFANFQILTAFVMMQFVKSSYPNWLRSYAAEKKDLAVAYDSLRKLMERFAARHGFSQRTISPTSVSCGFLYFFKLEMGSNFFPIFRNLLKLF